MMLLKWQIRLAAALLCAGLAQGGSNTVLVVHGDESAPPGDRLFAQSLARHAVRWYRDAGLDVTLCSDTRLAEYLPRSRVAVLVECANPPASQLAAWRKYVQGGGRLIVCYSTSPQLAEIMGVELGGYAKGDTGGRWSCMHFEAQRPQGVPERILQTSPNLFLVKPY